MRVAMVSEHASPLAALGGVDAGGQNVHVAALSAALAARGHEVDVYTRRDDEALPRVVPLSPGVRVVHLDAGPPLPLPKDALLPHVEALGRELAAALLERPADLLHAHFWMSGVAAREAAASVGVPVVQTFHALGSVKRRWQGAEDTSPPSRVSVEAQLAGSADLVLATCRDEVRELAELGAPAERVDVVPCGVDLDAFTPSGEVGGPPRHQPHRVLVVGRLVERKGVEDVVRALALVPAGAPGHALSRTELLVAGGPAETQLGLDAYARHLRDVAAEVGVGERVRLLGRVGHGDLPALLRSADVVVAAPWYEPFGIVPLEAMACGVPVVGSAVGGLLDTVDDGVSGVLVPPRDPVALAAALGPLLADDERRRTVGLAARERAEQGYGWARVAARTEDAYRRVLARTPAAAPAWPAAAPGRRHHERHHQEQA
ncbi:glycosyltransferase [Pseudokineococcus sp. 1T1Z-3]|uniref:glycosyltransferase n=1 Tax=Pseudokineococcus sp. 1T1Z-3 TaxID=3132745 RepID=UPI0030ACDA80